MITDEKKFTSRSSLKKCVNGTRINISWSIEPLEARSYYRLFSASVTIAVFRDAALNCVIAIKIDERAIARSIRRAENESARTSSRAIPIGPLARSQCVSHPRRLDQEGPCVN